MSRERPGSIDLRALAFDASPLPTAVLDRGGLIVFTNAAARSRASLAPRHVLGHAVGRTYDDFCGTALRGVSALRGGLAEVLAGSRDAYVGEFRCRGASERWMQITVARLRTAGFDGAVVVHNDVTERRRAEARALHRALHDPLTGLPNRALLEDRLDHAVASVRRHFKPIAVALFDLDDFKAINDTFGHLVGDQVLGEIARRGGRAVRGSDTLARLGGDEFALILHDVAHQGAVREVVAKVLREIDLPIALGVGELSVTSCAGVALCPSHGLDRESLLAHADAALYEAKARGPGTVAVYRRSDETPRAIEAHGSAIGVRRAKVA